MAGPSCLAQDREVRKPSQQPVGAPLPLTDASVPSEVSGHCRRSELAHPEVQTLSQQAGSACSQRPSFSVLPCTEAWETAVQAQTAMSETWWPS